MQQHSDDDGRALHARPDAAQPQTQRAAEREAQPQRAHTPSRRNDDSSLDATSDTTARHANAMRSQQHSADTHSTPLKTRADLERARIKVELARLRSSGSADDIPSGRVFDSPPQLDASASAPAVTAAAATETAQELTAFTTSTTTQQDTDAQPTKPAAPPRDGVDMLAQAALLKMDEDAPGTDAPRAAHEDDASRPLDEAAQEDASDKAVNGSTPVALEPASQLDSATPDAAASAADTTRQAAPKLRAVPDENRPLNESLVSEVELFASMMLGAAVPSRANTLDRAIHATTLQLFHDHRRALSDFDADWRRSHAARSNQTFARGGKKEQPNGATSALANAAENPFKRREDAPTDDAQWASLLNCTSVQCSTVADEQLKPPSDATKLDALITRGLNGIVVAENDRDVHRSKLCALLADFTRTPMRPGLHLIVASSRELAAWHTALASSDSVAVCSYWGEKDDRDDMLTLLRATTASSTEHTQTHVVLTSFDVFADDVRALGAVQWQVVVVDVPSAVVSQVQLNAVWMQLLGLRTRHRLLVAHPELHVDTRRILQFLLPGLFASRRKLLAWNCAAFDVDLIHRMCDVVEAFALVSERPALDAFLATATQCSIAKSDQELSTLSLLDKCGLPRRSATRSVRKHNRPKLKSAASKSSPLANGKGRRLSDDLSTQLALKKRRGSDGGGGDGGGDVSRQRVGRCGKCVGCLAGDCMTCGHCQDMKKYGGPGLRKQSCKNRKCINPRRWGMASKRSRRSRAKKQQTQTQANGDDEAEDTSEKYDSDLDDGATSYYSQDSDRDSAFSASASHDVGLSDSDASEDVRSRSSHDGHASANGKAHAVGEQDLEALARRRTSAGAKASATARAFDGAMLYHRSSGNRAVDARTHALLTLVQECEVFMDRHLVHTCESCVARFSARALLELHERVEHAASASDLLEVAASRLLLHPVHQLGFINAQLREKKRTLRSSPRAFAKLEGPGLVYFVMAPCIVLGRMSAPWRDLYARLGLSSATGLASDDRVDCHVCDDASVAEQHALIAWDSRVKRFTIECLSAMAPVCVNGAAVHVDDAPLALASRSEIRIGSASFYFLLPKTAAAGAEQATLSSSRAGTRERVPRSDAQAWVHAAVRKRRGSPLPSTATSEMELELAAIKRRCQLRLEQATSSSSSSL